MISVLSLLAAYAARYDYSNQDSWDGACPNSGLQQSPIKMSADDGGSREVDLVLKKSGNINQLYQHFDADAHKLYLRWKSEEDVGSDIISFDYNGANYTLDHIHSHWGQAEHVVVSDDPSIGGDTDGCYHLVFKATSNLGYWTPFNDNTLYAVIEVRIKYTTSKEGAVAIPRCPNVDSLNPAPCVQGGDDTAPVPLPGLPTILEALGWSDATDDKNAMLHYIGSLTTPSCTGPVQWFVRKEITKVYDSANDKTGCRSFASLYPRDSATCTGASHYGNFRDLQPKQTSFTAYNASFVTSDGNNCPKSGSSRSFYY